MIEKGLTICQPFLYYGVAVLKLCCFTTVKDKNRKRTARTAHFAHGAKLTYYFTFTLAVYCFNIVHNINTKGEKQCLTVTVVAQVISTQTAY